MSLNLPEHPSHEFLKTLAGNAWPAAARACTSNTVEVQFEEDLYSPFYGGRQFSILAINGLTLIFWQPEWLGPSAAA